MAKTFGIPLKLILAIRNVWIAIRSKLHLDPEEFRKYCETVIEMYEAFLPWAEMPPTLHKILFHGHQFIKRLPKGLTLGHLNEEPLESTHKRIRNYAKFRASQKSKYHRLRDVFGRISAGADPLILSKTCKISKKKAKPQKYPEEVLIDSDEIQAVPSF